MNRKTSEPAPDTDTPRWRMPWLVKASLLCHAAALLMVIAAPAQWAWAVGLLVVNHLLLACVGLWPRSTALGANLRRLPEAAAARGQIALTIDDGPDPDITPQVLDQLRAAGARATFFCIGTQAEAHPELVRRILREGHSVQNHSQRHSHRFAFSGLRSFEREIAAGQATFERLTGRAPTCFRAPAGLRNPFLDPVLHRLGLRLVSWTRRGFDTRERDPARVLARLTDGLRAGDILLLHDRHCALTEAGRPVVLEVLPALLEQCRRAGLRLVTLPEALSEQAVAATPAMLAS